MADHSPYIASRLGLYQQAGRDKLDVWLARMGIPLEECRQEYAYMRKQYKADSLFDKMTTHGNEFGLVNLTYPSFRCITSYGNTQIAAADLVSAVGVRYGRSMVSHHCQSRLEPHATALSLTMAAGLMRRLYLRIAKSERARRRLVAPLRRRSPLSPRGCAMASTHRCERAS